MKLKINGTTIDALCAANIAQHIEWLDEQISKLYYEGFRACGADYQQLCGVRESLIETYNYFSVEPYVLR